MQGDEVLLDRDLVGRHAGLTAGQRRLGRSRPHIDIIPGDAQLGRINNAFPCGDIKLPGMPWATHNLAVAAPLVFPDGTSNRRAGYGTFAERRSLVRADIANGVILSFDIKDADGAAFDLDNPATSRLQFGDAANRMGFFGCGHEV